MKPTELTGGYLWVVKLVSTNCYFSAFQWTVLAPRFNKLLYVPVLYVSALYVTVFHYALQVFELRISAAMKPTELSRSIKLRNFVKKVSLNSNHVRA